MSTGTSICSVCVFDFKVDPYAQSLRCVDCVLTLVSINHQTLYTFVSRVVEAGECQHAINTSKTPNMCIRTDLIHYVYQGKRTVYVCGEATASPVSCTLRVKNYIAYIYVIIRIMYRSHPLVLASPSSRVSKCSRVRPRGCVSRASNTRVVASRGYTVCKHMYVCISALCVRMIYVRMHVYTCICIYICTS